jgi:hypothetical protein
MGPQFPVPGGAHETQLPKGPVVGYTPSRDWVGGGDGFGMPVPSPQTMAKPTCFLALLLSTQPSHFQVPETVTVRPLGDWLIEVGYGVSS